MKAFVTGCTGMLGSNLVYLLAERGHQVRALVRSEEKAKKLFGEQAGITFVVGDMENTEGFSHELFGNDVLFHTAAYLREYFVRAGNHGPKLERVNIRGTIKLLKAAEDHGVKKAIYVSAGGVIGRKPDGGPGDEVAPPSQLIYRNHYLRSKFLAEQEITKFLQHHKLPVVLILPGVILGPSDSGPTASGQFILDYIHGRIPGILGGGMPLVDARDVAEAMIAAIDKGRSGERYVIGGRYFDMEQIYELLEKATGIPAPRRRIPDAVARAVARISVFVGRLTGKPVAISPEGLDIILSRLQFDSSKAFKELGVSFRPTLDTLRDEVEWYKQHGFVKT